MAESKLRGLSIDFSVEILRICDGIKGHSSIVNQLERSATSIGASFISKQQLKDFMGYKSVNSVTPYLYGIKSVNRRYYIPDVVDRILL